MNEFEVVFTYPVADDFLVQTDNLKRTVTRKRKFHHRYWGFYIAKEGCKHFSGKEFPKGSIFGRLGEVYPENFDVSNPEKDDYKPIIVDVLKDPVVVDLFYPPKDLNLNDPAQFKQLVKPLPDGLVYTRPDITDLPPYLVYDTEKVKFNIEENVWETPFPYLKEWIDWDTISAMATSEYNFACERINNLEPDNPVYNEWVKFRDEMKNKVELYKKHGLRPVECVFSPHPKE